MLWLSIVLVAFAAGILFLQGVRVYGQRRALAAWPFGLLTVFVGTIVVTLAWLFAAGTLVHSPEFGIVMVQGRWASPILGALLVGLAVGTGLTWSTARVAAESRLPGEAWCFGALGLLVGLTSVFYGKQPAGSKISFSDARLAVYAYDLWWPPLLLWCVLGTLSSALLFGRPAFGRLSTKWRLWIVSSSACVVCAWASLQPQFQSNVIAAQVSSMWTRRIWMILSVITLALQLGASVWIGLYAITHRSPSVVKFADETPRIADETPGIGEERFNARDIYHWLTIAAVLLSLAIVVAMVRNFVPSKPFGVFAPSYFWGAFALGSLAGIQRSVRRFRDGKAIFAELTARQKATILTFVVAVATTIDIARFAWAPITVSLPLLALCCAVLAMMIANSSSELETPTQLAEEYGKVARAAGQIVTNRIRPVVPALKMTWTHVSDVKHWPVMIAKVLVALVLLLVVDELPNTRRLVIAPFHAHPSNDLIEIGPALSDKLFYRLRLMYQQMASDVLVPDGIVAPRAPGAVVGNVPAGAGADASLEHEKLSLGPVSLPLAAIARSIQEPLRWALGVREVNGTVQASGGWLRAFVAVDGGPGWVDSVHLEPKTGVTPPSEGQDSLDALADRLAFRLLSTTPEMAVSGMTTSWGAFQRFRVGVRLWQAFDRVAAFQPAMWVTLDSAIKAFRDATEIDPSFSLAYYRLGRALDASGETEAGAEALRASLEGSAYLPVSANALAFADSEHAGAQRRLWEGILLGEDFATSPVDRAAAFFGMCRNLRAEREVRLAYFFCKRAARVYRELPTSLSTSARAREVEGAVQFQLGVLLSEIDSSRKIPTGGWTCSRDFDSVSAVPSRFARAAVEYFEKAARLQPGGVNTRCRNALVRVALGDLMPLRELRSDYLVRRVLGDQYFDAAIEAAADSASAGDFARAAAEYEAANDDRPYTYEVLNDYAYIVWRWRHRFPGSRGPSEKQMHQAEIDARTAVELVQSSHVDFQVTARSTLGEILLAEGRPHEAVDVLQEIPPLPAHRKYDEDRLDMARALVCAAARDEHSLRIARSEERALDTTRYLARADQLLDSLSRRHSQFIRDTLDVPPSELSRAGIRSRCHGLTSPVHSDISIDVDWRSAATFAPCGWRGIDVNAPASLNTPSGSRVHIWGPDIELLVPSRSGKAEPSDIHWLGARAPTHDRYFMRLEDSTGAGLSETIDIDRQSASKRKCAAGVLHVAYHTTSGIVQAGSSKR
jgi:tetratricopeptide (TPR) repeat protein